MAGSQDQAEALTLPRLYQLEALEVAAKEAPVAGQERVGLELGMRAHEKVRDHPLLAASGLPCTPALVSSPMIAGQRRGRAALGQELHPQSVHRALERPLGVEVG